MSSKKRKSYKSKGGANRNIRQAQARLADTQPSIGEDELRESSQRREAPERPSTVAQAKAAAARARSGQQKGGPVPGSSASIITAFNEDKATTLHIDFIGKRYIYYIISTCIILAGLIMCVVTGGVKMSIDFKGGTIIKYSYTGTVSDSAIRDIAKDVVKSDVSVSLNTVAASNTKLIVIEIDKRSISATTQSDLFTKVSEKYSGNSITKYENNDVDPSMGADFLRKSIFEVLLASLLIVIYIWFRFRKIGGLPAGITAFIALVHDAAIIFVTFVFFGIPLDENYIAVTLMVLGYSINDTIVIFDRIRENRTRYGDKIPFDKLVNRSVNQSFSRSINTSLSTFVAIAVVFIFATIFHIDSIYSFALPMMVGVITGCYSTICIAGSLWVDWVRHQEKKNPPKSIASGKRVIAKA
jgi:preprotein translocase subunit SecF